MREEHRDAVEEWTVVGAQLALGYVPVAGPVLAAVFGKAAGSAAQRRTERIIGELVADVQQLRERRGLPSDAVAESDEFIAAMQRTVRRLVESDTAEKRKLLRNALLNQCAGYAMDHEFDQLLERLDADDVRILQVMEEMTGPGADVKHAPWHSIEAWFDQHDNPPPRSIYRRTRLLDREGLLRDPVTARIEEGRADYAPAYEDVEQSAAFAFGVTDRGSEFLAYVRDPLA